MAEKRINYWRNQNELPDLLIGHRVVEASVEDGTLVLDNGVRITFAKSNDDCCSWIELTDLTTTNNIILAASFDGDADEGPYTAHLHVVTEAGELNIATADGDASNGYYLHGFALDATVTFPDE